MNPRTRAFSLVELSIVLVILGLLIGGILAGKSLIRASELRSVTTQHQGYVTAVNSFKDRYFALPGDMANATLVWGKDNTNCSGNTGTAATPGTCNGDGNNQVGNSNQGSTEALRLWQQLNLAGLVEGNYTGLLSGGTAVAGINLPLARVPNGVWIITYRDPTGNNPIYGQSANYLNLGAASVAYGNYWGTPLLPSEAWTIDTKIDDGKPGQGMMFGGGDSGQCITPNGIDYGASGATNTGAAYNQTATTFSCRLWFKLQ